MRRIYVKDYTYESVDEEQLQVVKIYPASERPNRYSYIVFQEKGTK
jgi:hypothetical protein